MHVLPARCWRWVVGEQLGVLLLPGLWSNDFVKRHEITRPFFSFLYVPKDKLEIEKSQLALQNQQDPSGDIYWWKDFISACLRTELQLLALSCSDVSQTFTKTFQERWSSFGNYCRYIVGEVLPLLSTSILFSE